MRRSFLILAFGTITLLLAWVWYAQSFARRGCFNALGRCFDEESGVVYHEQSGLVWLTLALVSGALTLWIALRRRR